MQVSRILDIQRERSHEGIVLIALVRLCIGQCDRQTVVFGDHVRYRAADFSNLRLCHFHFSTGSRFPG